MGGYPFGYSPAPHGIGSFSPRKPPPPHAQARAARFMGRRFRFVDVEKPSGRDAAYAKKGTPNAVGGYTPWD